MKEAAFISAGDALVAAGLFDEALLHFQRALYADPANVEASLRLIGLHVERRDLSQATRTLTDALAKSPFDLRLIAEKRRVGLALYSAGFWEDAAAWLQSASAIEPWDRRLGAAYARTRRPDYLGPDRLDRTSGKPLQRFAAREGDAYIYVIDIVGTCNLRCPTCPVGNSTLDDRPTGLMAYDLFETIVDKIARESPSARPIVNLYNWGEPLLNPDLPRMIALLRQRGMKSSLSSNLNIRRGLEDVIAANPDELKISLSGFTEATYPKTHTRGNLELLKSNMRSVRDFAVRHGATTHVWVGHHIYKSNQHEVPAVRQFCEELGFAYHPIAAFYMPLERLVEHLQGQDNPRDGGIIADLLHPPADRQRAAATRRHQSFDCELRFNQTVINHDGSVALCCTVYDRPNMLGKGFLDADFETLEHLKYEHPFCDTCYAQHLEYAPVDLMPEGD